MGRWITGGIDGWMMDGWMDGWMGRWVGWVNKYGWVDRWLADSGRWMSG
jgi:hypothetical protein